VRLVERAGALTMRKGRFRGWLRAYLEWLQTSEQGLAERLTRNNHGTCYDLQTGAIAAFLGDAELLERTFLTSRERILDQFTAEGQQPHEMARTQTAHYCLFQSAMHGSISRRWPQACGHDLWSFEGQDGRGLARALRWLLPHMTLESWPHEQIEPFDTGRSSRSISALATGRGRGPSVSRLSRWNNAIRCSSLMTGSSRSGCSG
jgi:hypothetical protein